MKVTDIIPGRKKLSTLYLDGQPDLSEYPAEDAKVELLGVVTIGDYDVRALTVLPENVKTVD